MKMSELVNALAYELGLWLISKNPDLAFNPWVQRMWVLQARLVELACKARHEKRVWPEQIIEEWAEDNRKARCNKLAKARDKFPNATITPVEDAVIPMVIIERKMRLPLWEAPCESLGGLKISLRQHRGRWCPRRLSRQRL